MQINFPKMDLDRKTLNYIVLITSSISYAVYLIFYINFDAEKSYESAIIPLSWLGVLVGLYIVFTWYKLTNKLFSLYLIFMLFFFLFNYGQPLMWTLGIHQPNEIGAVGLYTLSKPTSSNLVLTQALTLISIMMFHLGAFFCYKNTKETGFVSSSAKIVNNKLTLKAILYTSIFLSFIVIPVTFFNTIYDFIYSQQHGYRALYYDNEKSNFVLFNLIQHLFFPTLVGLLIGSNYKKNIMYFVYSVFTLYLSISLLSGERGSWIFYLIILLYMRHTFYKKFTFKSSLTISISGLLFLYLVNVIVSLRNVGINIGNILSSLSLKNSPIVSFIFEMGGSMRPALVLIQYGWDVYPYGNSYFNSLIGIVSSRVFNMLNIPFDPLSSWFSQEYLDIPYGAGFSIVAEPLINYGPVFAPLFLILLGYILISLTFLDGNFVIKNNSLRIVFAICTMSIFLKIVRNHSHFLLKSWFYGVVVFIILIYFVRKLLSGESYLKKRLELFLHKKRKRSN